MDENEKIFLTRKQVLDAIRMDFVQYESQFDLYQELCPILTDSREFISQEGRNDCLLITRGKKSKTRRMNDQELGRYLLNTLKANSYPLSVLAEICSKVFRTTSWTGRHGKTGVNGIWIKTDMAFFKCRQCGNCCRNLNYQKDCTEKDYRRWKTLGREDILEKVMIIHHESIAPEYRIWIKLDSSQLYTECPWLVTASSKGRFECEIQDVKPEFCRQYPLTRKHADMTGCRGTFGQQCS